MGLYVCLRSKFFLWSLTPPNVGSGLVLVLLLSLSLFVCRYFAHSPVLSLSLSLSLSHTHKVHMNVMFTVAHMILMRDSLLSGDIATLQAMLWWHKDLPPLDADLVVTLSLHLVKKLPDELYSRLEKHPYVA